MTTPLPKPPSKTEFCLQVIIDKLNGLQAEMEKIQRTFQEIFQETDVSEKETFEDLSGEETSGDEEDQ